MDSGGPAGEKQSAEDGISHTEGTELQSLHGQIQRAAKILLGIKREELSENPHTGK